MWTNGSFVALGFVTYTQRHSLQSQIWPHQAWANSFSSKFWLLSISILDTTPFLYKYTCRELEFQTSDYPCNLVFTLQVYSNSSQKVLQVFHLEVLDVPLKVLMQRKIWHIALFPKTVKVSSFCSVFAKLECFSVSCRNWVNKDWEEIKPLS